MVASALSIKLVLGDDGAGEIKAVAKCLSIGKALSILKDFPTKKVAELGADNMMVVISHCLNPEAAEKLAQDVREKHGITNIKIVKMRGLSSFYANKKGLIIAV